MIVYKATIQCQFAVFSSSVIAAFDSHILYNRTTVLSTGLMQEGHYNILRMFNIRIYSVHEQTRMSALKRRIHFPGMKYSLKIYGCYVQSLK
jgi:hypothetical protein